MGSYTSQFRFYKPATSGEVVDVDTQLNSNLDIVDLVAKGMFDYETYSTNVASIDVATISKRFAGHKFYKPYSNSVWASQGQIFVPEQDLTAYVRSWVDASSLISTSSGTWASYPNAGLYYRFIQNNAATVTEIEWTGRIWLGGSAITANSTYSGVINLPASLTPVTGKYFNVYAGNTTSSYAMARLLFNTDNTVSVTKYGAGTATSSVENYIDFTGIRYPLEPTA